MITWMIIFSVGLISFMFYLISLRHYFANFKSNSSIIVIKNKYKYYFLACGIIFIAAGILSLASLLKTMNYEDFVITFVYLTSGAIWLIKARIPNGLYRSGIMESFKFTPWKKIKAYKINQDTVSFEGDYFLKIVMKYDTNKREDVEAFLKAVLRL